MTLDPIANAVSRWVWPIQYVLDWYHSLRHPENPLPTPSNPPFVDLSVPLESRVMDSPITPEPLPVGISLGCGGTYTRHRTRPYSGEITISPDGPKVDGQLEDRTEDS